ncbi:hypothetical protein [Fructobacillus evanidus]|uniref:Uncharacterized protein n=1 Tax=Fructobacillus evanidus TaxID=3064281 RepID=A0ABM9MQ16_9LACO|nr:hypothetical protein R53718_MFFEMHAI_00414 [Fructobacillus sp. LMG 32999]CAK1232026.1 hypothetical protein R55214_HHFBAMCI_00403 [Fructobacillus sp. LMG 32999]CAK1232558.1 hypothetical protein R55203_MFJFHIJN_00424 [Fructobacillus sp. LMG 32999]CAK1236043.1 hypothetical protein R54837_OMAIDLJD_00588 [Fructobacillus sp. LMG 32999]CAK1238458.1 hypothetical protein R55250_KEHBDPNM_01114 [Fructobacillus sp. LMG 32999]
MSEYKIQFTVDGQKVDETAIREMELSRYHHVFDEFVAKNIPITLDQQVIPADQLKTLPLSSAKKALAQTKEAIGKEGMLKYYHDEIHESDEMWKEIAENASPKMQQAIVEVETENISLIQFMLFNQSLAKENNLYLPSKIHPEHYYFDAGKGGTQTIVETFGMYRKPSYLHLVPGDHIQKPIPTDSDTTMVMLGQTLLADTMADTKIIGMHQLKNKPNGMKVKLGVFLPENAPKEIIEGHKWHLMVEFNNGLHIAADKKANFLQKIILGQAIKQMAKKNQK